METCQHKWETIDKYQKYIGMSGNFFTEKYRHYSWIYVQECEICGKIEQSELK